LQLLAEKQTGADAGRKSPNPIAPPSAVDPAVVAASIGGAPQFIPAASSLPPVAKTDKWWYKDPQGEVQGPFSAEDMTTWLLAGYFGADLLVRRGDSLGDFTMLGKVFFDEQRHPFSGQSLLEFYASKPTIHPFKTQLMQLQQQHMLLMQQKASVAGPTPAALAQLLAAASLAAPSATPSPATVNPALLLLQQQLAQLKLTQPAVSDDASNPLAQILAAANLAQQQQATAAAQQSAPQQPAPSKPSVAPWAGWGKQTAAAPAATAPAAAPAPTPAAATATAAALSQQQQLLQQQVQKQQSALQQMAAAPAKPAEPSAAELTRKQGVFRIEDLERGAKAAESETRKSQEVHKDSHSKKNAGVPWSASAGASAKSLREIQEQEALSRAPGSAPAQAQPVSAQPTTKEVSAAALVEAAADPSLKSLWGALFQKPIEEDSELLVPEPEPEPVKVHEPAPKSKKGAKSGEAPWNPQPSGKSLAEIQAEELKRKQEEDTKREREQAEARKQQQAQKKAGWTQSQQQPAKKAAPQPVVDPSKPKKKTLLDIQQEELEAERRKKQQEEEEAAAMASAVGSTKKPLFGAWAAPAATQRNIVPLSQIQQQEAAAAAKSGSYSMAATIAKATKSGGGGGGGGVWNNSPSASPAKPTPAPMVDEDEDDSFWDYPTSKPAASAGGAKKVAPAPSKAPASGAAKKRGKKPKKLVDPSSLGFAAPSRPVDDDDDE
jgi:PERQ amino acid-rich with GYF domain-containing protein